MSEKKSVSVIIAAVDKFSKPIKNFNKTTQKFSKSIVNMQKKLGKISGFKKLEKQLGKTSTELSDARSKLKSLGREVKSTERPTRRLISEFERAKSKVQILSRAHKKQTSVLREERAALRGAGVDTRNLSKEEGNLTKNLNKQFQMLGKVTKRRKMLNKLTAGMDKASSRAANFALVGQAGSQFSRSIFNKGRDLVGSVRELDVAKGALASLGVKDIDVIANAGADLSKRLSGVSSASFVGASYNIKSGIDTLSDKGVAEMTKAAVITAKATKASEEEMTSLFGTGYGIFKRQFAGQSDKDFGGLFSAAITKSVQQFKTTGSGMQQAIQSMGSGPTNLGVPLAEQLAVLGKLQGVMTAGEAGTSMRAFAQNSAKAQEAFSKLAEEGDNSSLVRLLDSKGMMRSLPSILTDIHNRYGDSLNAIELEEIKKAFGTDEAVKLINNLFGQEKSFGGGAQAILEAQKAGLKFTESVAKLSDNTPTARLDMLIQRINLLKETIGGKLLSVFDKFHIQISTGIESLSVWAKANGKLILGGIMLATVLGGLAALLVPLALGVSVLNGVLSLFKGLLLTISVLTSPLALQIGAIAVAVGLLAGAGYLVVKNWEPLMNFFDNIGVRVKSVFAGVVATILESMREVLAVMPSWALPKSLETKNIGSTINKYRSIKKSGIMKPISFRGISGVPDSLSFDSVGESLGFDGMLSMLDGSATKSVVGSGGKVLNNNFRLDAPITINASSGMSVEDIAIKAREELENLLNQMQRRSEESAYD